MPVLDTFQRPLGSLRISVTDRCNLRCQYCMPELDYVWIPRRELLTFEEIDRLVGVFAGLGVDKIRLTGGEPLLRRNLDRLVSAIAGRDGVREVTLTSNGLLLADQIESLAKAGLSRVTISLDTLRADRFESLTRRGGLDRVLAGIDAVADVGLVETKVNCVVMRGFNDDEIVDLLEFGRRRTVEVRFIEYMDVGGATGWSMNRVFSRRDILAVIEARFGTVRVIETDPFAPADRFALADGTVFGVISSATAPFCDRCDRSRLTADGHWFRCLYARDGLDMKSPLRGGASADKMAHLIRSAWRERADRGAEQRLAVAVRGPLASVEELRGDHRLEMHTRGG